MAKLEQTLGARLSYAQVWEDTRVLLGGLELKPGARVLSIASGGDNCLALALAGAHVTAIDLSEAQLAVLELKMVGSELSYRQYRQLLGVDPGLDAVALYRKVRDHLGARSRTWWDAHPEVLKGGVVRSGRFEQYLALFRRFVLPLVHRPSTLAAWADLADLTAQRRFYRDRWDGLRWRWLCRAFFSRRVMASRGRSPEQFAHVHGPVAERILARAERVLTVLPLTDNGYAQWMLTGRWWSDEGLPTYLTREGHGGLRQAVGRIELVHDSLAHHANTVEATRYDGFNLSDVFEYLDEASANELYRSLLRVAAPGARLVYWNLFVPRERPADLAVRVVRHRAIAKRLFASDRAFVYGDLQVDEVIG